MNLHMIIVRHVNPNTSCNGEFHAPALFLEDIEGGSAFNRCKARGRMNLHVFEAASAANPKPGFGRQRNMTVTGSNIPSALAISVARRISPRHILANCRVMAATAARPEGQLEPLRTSHMDARHGPGTTSPPGVHVSRVRVPELANYEQQNAYRCCTPRRDASRRGARQQTRGF